MHAYLQITGDLLSVAAGLLSLIAAGRERRTRTRTRRRRPPS